MIEALWVLQQGGWPSYALAAASVMLWASLVVRLMTLQPAGSRNSGVVGRFRRNARALQGHPKRLRRLAERSLSDLATLTSPIRTLVAVAPLLGLLGTVMGMVEMFSSIRGSSVSAESTVAGGISTALISTQLGLVITVPGLLAGFLLKRLQLRREREVKAEFDRLAGGAV